MLKAFNIIKSIRLIKSTQAVRSFGNLEPLENRIMEYFSIRDKKIAKRIWFGVIGASAIGSFGYGTWKYYLGQEASKVATTALQQQNVRQEAIILARESISILAEDPVVIAQLRNMMIKILRDKQFVKECGELVEETLVIPRVRQTIGHELTVATKEVINDKEVKDLLSKNLFQVFKKSLFG